MLLLSFLFTGTLLSSSLGLVHAATLNTHTILYDQNNKIMPWNSSGNDAYQDIVQRNWNYLYNNVPVVGNGKPAYYSHSYLNPDTQQPVGWPHNPAGLYAMFTESAIKWYRYSGDAQALGFAQNLLDHHLANGMTLPTDNWASVPYASGDDDSLTYRGASYGNSTGVGDGQGVIEPDKVGALGNAFLQMYEITGNTNYRDAAINAANQLASHIRTGNATQSPWPFRVVAANNTVKQQYTANVIDPIQLFDELVRLGLGNTSSYQSARTSAWNWMYAYPIQTNSWDGYFEDVQNISNLTNSNQITPMTVARYLIEHPEYDANWETTVRNLISYVENTFGQQQNGAMTIREQQAFMHAMGSHTSRYAAVNALLYAKTGDQAAKEKAYRSFNWATYRERSNGVTIDGPTVNNQWFTDGHADYIRHFLTGMAAVPEWAPSGQDHMVDASGIVKSVSYGTGQIDYTAANPAATEKFKLSFVPASVTVDGNSLPQSSSGDGWTYDSNQNTLEVRHSAGTQFRILSGGVANIAPSVSMTAPATGATITLGDTVTLSATASDSDGTIDHVDFLANGNAINTTATSPYNYAWTPTTAGTYTITARATDNGGISTMSPPISITVQTPTGGNLPAPWTDYCRSHIHERTYH